MDKLITVYTWSVKAAILALAIFLFEGCVVPVDQDATGATVRADFDEVQGPCDGPASGDLLVTVDLAPPSLPQVPQASCTFDLGVFECSYVIGADVAVVVMTIHTDDSGLLIVRTEPIGDGAAACTWRYKIVEIVWTS